MIKHVFKIFKFIFIGVVVIGGVYQLFLEEGLHAIPIIIWGIFLFVIAPGAFFLLNKEPHFIKLNRALDKTPVGKAFLILVLIGIIAFVVIAVD
jgi:hypothetical protein